MAIVVEKHHYFIGTFHATWYDYAQIVFGLGLVIAGAVNTDSAVRKSKVTGDPKTTRPSTHGTVAGAIAFTWVGFALMITGLMLRLLRVCARGRAGTILAEVS